MKPRLSFLVISLFLAITLAQSQNAVSKHYDTEKAIQLKGAVTSAYLMGREHVGFLFIEVEDVNGKVEEWAVTGNPEKALLETGWVLVPPSPTLKHRELVTVIAYLPRPDTILADVSPSVARATSMPGLPSPAERFNAGRFAFGTEVTLSSGKKLVFGDLK